MAVTPIYAALLALVFIVLSVRVIKLRYRHRVAIGHGGQSELERAMRVQANFAEYVPLTLLLIFMLEIVAGTGLAIHILAVMLLVGRILHGYGVSHRKEQLKIRRVGMGLTFASLLGAAISILVWTLGP